MLHGQIPGCRQIFLFGQKGTSPVKRGLRGGPATQIELTSRFSTHFSYSLAGREGCHRTASGLRAGEFEILALFRLFRCHQDSSDTSDVRKLSTVLLFFRYVQNRYHQKPTCFAGLFIYLNVSGLALKV